MRFTTSTCPLTTQDATVMSARLCKPSLDQAHTGVVAGMKNLCCLCSGRRIEKEASGQERLLCKMASKLRGSVGLVLSRPQRRGPCTDRRESFLQRHRPRVAVIEAMATTDDLTPVKLLQHAAPFLTITVPWQASSHLLPQPSLHEVFKRGGGGSGDS